MSRSDLAADCARCCALCCLAPAFYASPEFALSKDAHTPCALLRTNDRCSIHAELRARGFGGCAVYDCHGAGQKVMHVIYGGRSWRDVVDPAEMFDVFLVVRALHELLVLLEGALRIERSAVRRERLAALLARVEAATRTDARELLDLDVRSFHKPVHALLREVGKNLTRARQRPLPVL